MEQNKPQTEQDISQQAAVRRQKLADLRRQRPLCYHQISAGFLLR